jgi:hypothetical protein
VALLAALLDPFDAALEAGAGSTGGGASAAARLESLLVPQSMASR